MEKRKCGNCSSTKPVAEFRRKPGGEYHKLCNGCLKLFSGYRKAQRKRRLCWCGAPTSGTWHCDKHRAEVRDRMRERRALLPPKICKRCNTNAKEPRKRLCSECNQISRRKVLDQQKARWRTRVGAIYARYGGARCVCCGETAFEFLTLDHIGNDGASHRREMGGSGTRTYRWIETRNFPTGFQVLCYNCNAGRYRNGGVCPHKAVAATA